jgi:hypothetical protein
VNARELLTGVPDVPVLPNACAQCPWRLSNQGTPHPHGFYTKANIKRLWDGLRTGAAPGMSCHPTDSRMADYEGYEQTAEREQMYRCTGSAVMVAREVARFQAFTREVEREQEAGAKLRRDEALRRYRAEAGRYGMSRDGLSALVWQWMTHSFEFPPVEAINDPDLGSHLTVAWDAAILDRAFDRKRA